MSKNPTLSRSLACLTHPLSLAAMALLLLNDHLFRIVWPGWWTGKLGDFVWLFFFPFALAVILAIIIPGNWARSDSWIAILAFGSTGSIFTLTKTWTPFHTGLSDAFSRLFGWQLGWVMDATDLLALISLAAAAWVWMRSKSRPLHQPRPILLLLGMVGFLTLANSPMPETGITCLKIKGEQIYAYSTHYIYKNEGEGMNWREAGSEVIRSYEANDGCNPFIGDIPSSFIVSSQKDAGVAYRITRGESIERSQDNGQTWQLELRLKPEAEAMRAYYTFRSSGNAEYFSGPFDAIFDPSSGNLILAMGHSGVLVRQADGSYSWAEVGIHTHEEPAISLVFFILFPGEIWMALILGGLSVWILGLRQRRFSFRYVMAGISALGWLFVAVLMPPALSYGYGQTIVMLVLAASGILMLPLVVEVLIRAGLSSRLLLLRYIIVLLVSAVLFFLPFIAWGLNTLPNYRLAQVFAIVLAGGWVFWQHRLARSNKLEQA